MKKCFKCREEKPLTEFYRQKKMKDGHLNKCKVCTKDDVHKHRQNNIDKVRAYDRERAKSPHRMKRNTEATQKMRKDFPHVYKAHTKVGNALRDGKITKPEKCETCNRVGQLHGHHDDYVKPLDVRWLCAACHRQFHRDLEAIWNS